MNEKQAFLFPRTRYYGKFTPQNLAFNANLQQFAQRVSVIANLETNGKLASEQAFNQVQALWIQLETSLEQLEIR